MLASLAIRDVVLIEALDLDFDGGLGVDYAHARRADHASDPA